VDGRIGKGGGEFMRSLEGSGRKSDRRVREVDIRRGKKNIRRGEVGKWKRSITDRSRIVLVSDVSSNIKLPESKFPERRTKFASRNSSSRNFRGPLRCSHREKELDARDCNECTGEGGVQLRGNYAWLSLCAE
jgi:hypothetical protein